MEQHPIPQQISSYEFKLVGNMTLKQFAKAGGGIIVAVLINSSKLLFFVKYPLMAIFGLGGIALAFVPFEDRPLETWLMAFIRSIYSPTIYIWKKVRDKNWLDLDIKSFSEGEHKGKESLKVETKDGNMVEEFIVSLPKIGNREKDIELSSADYKVEKKVIDEEIGLKEEEKIKDVEKKEEEEIEKIEEKKEIKKVSLDLKKADKLEATGKAVFGGVPMPVTPTMPNVLSGMVMGKNGKIIEEAIVEVQDDKGNSVRVFRTNSLGQFKSANQLASGKYLVITEKDGYKFNRVNVELKGEILEPIRIEAVL
ncbi:hypothetical protein DRH14_02100 [Candidatus Shapirobacteria bacterium]|nr:MAG: hypothetical protein DRH14_02100 [Candidatus Shapirobacteria bacterium]